MGGVRDRLAGLAGLSRESRRPTRRIAGPEVQVVAAARELLGSGLLSGTVGNVSVRCGGEVCITPTRAVYRDLCAGDVPSVDLDGTWLRGRLRPSRELAVHLALYRQRPDVNAVVHTHSPHATAWSFLGAPLTPLTEEVEYYRIGAVRTAAHAPAGSAELAGNAVQALGDSRAVLLARHGVVAAGETLDLAGAIAEAVEHQAHVAWLLRAPATAPPPRVPNADELIRDSTDRLVVPATAPP